jgi:small subunit ribosomal protein S4
MGDPKFPRRTYDTPSHPWEGERIKKEQELVRKYGLKNKRELWKAQSILRNFRQQSRELQARLRYEEAQADIEKEKLLKRCGNMGILPMDGTTLDDVLGLNPESILNRRLQTLVTIKGLASTNTQARQLIVHGHIIVDERRVTIPGYLVKRGEEAKIEYSARSPYANELHPIRVQQAEAESKRVTVSVEREEGGRKRGPRDRDSKGAGRGRGPPRTRTQRGGNL